jgi:hypothetical protein
MNGFRKKKLKSFLGDEKTKFGVKTIPLTLKALWLL